MGQFNISNQTCSLKLVSQLTHIIMIRRETIELNKNTFVINMQRRSKIDNWSCFKSINTKNVNAMFLKLKLGRE